MGLNAYEPSVYGAGDIDSSNPYGLTSTEKNVLTNRRQLQLLRNKVTEQQDRIDGLTTLIEGLNKQIFELQEQLKQAERITLASEKRAAEDSNKTYGLLLNLGKVIDQINKSYITQEDLTRAIESVRAEQREELARRSRYEEERRAMMMAQEDEPHVVQGAPITAIPADLSEVYREGVQLFSHKSYYAAKEKFERALAQGYKAAPSSYYLGEIAYYTGEYRDAIAYYKKSASLNDSAHYMKNLFLHTAIALDRIGERAQAKSFFQYILNHYPGTQAAAVAQENL